MRQDDEHFGQAVAPKTAEAVAAPEVKKTTFGEFVVGMRADLEEAKRQRNVVIDKGGANLEDLMRKEAELNSQNLKLNEFLAAKGLTVDQAGKMDLGEVASEYAEKVQKEKLIFQSNYGNAPLHNQAALDAYLGKMDRPVEFVARNQANAIIAMDGLLSRMGSHNSTAGNEAN